jgi:aminoglycoside phosphotransferase family enzyme/predicted kinase
LQLRLETAIRSEPGDPMMADDQRDVISFLSTPEAYGGSAPSVERIDTHISVVWIAGDRVYKLKRAVRFDYVDFSTVELRRAACDAEVLVNRRTAPSLYLGVRPVTRDARGALTIGGSGTPVDWLVEMVRFDQDTLFDRLAEGHQLDPGLMEGLADAIARLHADAEPRFDHGGRDGMAWVIDGNARGFVEQGGSVLDPAACERLSADARAALDRHADRLDARRHKGFVRECHGDLHLRNICLVDGIPTLFDAVEFNDDISCIDVLYDVAFLLMDLWHRDLPSHANRVFNEYLARTADLDGLALMPLFLSCRAGVRAKTSATAAKVQPDDRQQRGLQAASRKYLALAQQHLRPSAPCLIAIGGLSGSGKSTLARRLAPGIGVAPGALIVRSDLIRKTLLNVSPLTRLGPEGYTAAMNARVYETMAERAKAALIAGNSVIADAVYTRPGDREMIAGIAAETGVPFTGLWVDGPKEVLARRLRERASDPSDATVEVMERQACAELGPLDWHRLDGSADVEGVQRSAEALTGAVPRSSS